MEIHEVTRPPAPVVRAPAPPPPAATPTRRPSKRAQAPQPAPAPQAPETPVASTDSKASASAASDVPSGPRELASDFPVRAESLLPRSLPEASAQVSPGSRPGTEPGTGAPGTRLRAPEPKGPGEMVRELVAQQKVRNGFVHAYFGQLQDVLLAAWRATGTSARRRSGRTCEVEVRLVQASSGRLQEVSIRFPSCDPSMDEEVLADLRAAAASLPAPPPEVVGHRDSIRSVYRFTFQPPPTLPPLKFDVVDLVDRKAIPKFNPKRVTLIQVE
jgi:TonB-like protein